MDTNKKWCAYVQPRLFVTHNSDRDIINSNQLLVYLFCMYNQGQKFLDKKVLGMGKDNGLGVNLHQIEFLLNF